MDQKTKNKTTLQQYAKYLRDILYSVNRDYGDVYWKLNQFYEEGRIKVLVGLTAPTKNKKEILSIIREEIVNFFEQNNYQIPIQDVEQFCKIKERKEKLKKIANCYTKDKK